MAIEVSPRGLLFLSSFVQLSDSDTSDHLSSLTGENSAPSIVPRAALLLLASVAAMYVKYNL